jgi:hypothetical protein
LLPAFAKPDSLAFVIDGLDAPLETAPVPGAKDVKYGFLGLGPALFGEAGRVEDRFWPLKPSTPAARSAWTNLRLFKEQIGTANTKSELGFRQR